MVTSTQFLYLPALSTAIDRNFLAVSPETSVAEVLILMHKGKKIAPTASITPAQLNHDNSHQPKNRIDYALVMVEQKISGIFSRNEIMDVVISGQDLQQTKVAQVMNTSFVTLTLSSQENLFTTLSLLKEQQLSCVPILDSNAELLGIITYQTICQVLEPAELKNLSTAKVQPNLEISPQQSLDFPQLIEPLIETTQKIPVLDEVFHNTANQLHEALQISRCLIFQYNAQNQLTAQYASDDAQDRDDLMGSEVQLHHYYHESLVAGEPVMLRRIDNTLPTNVQEFAHQHHILAYLAVPLIYQQSYWGCICFHDCHKEREWTKEEITFASVIATHCTMAVQHVQLYSQAQKSLREANIVLDSVVNEHTAALSQSNKYLRSEIIKRFTLTKQLQQSEAKLTEILMLQQAILDSASYTIIATSPTGMILTFNRTAEKLLGYKAAEVVGQTTPEIIHDREQMHRRAVELAQETGVDIQPGFTAVVAKARQGELEEREWTYVRKDGSCFPVLLSVTALRNETGKITGFLAIGRDITETKQVEASLRLCKRAIAASNNGIVIADANQPGMPVIYANPAFETITGYSPADVMGRNSRFLQGDDTGQPELEILRQALREHRSCTVVLRNYRQDGTPFWNELSISPIYDAQGNLTHYIGIQNDISERRNATEQLQQAKAQLQAVLDAVPGMVSWLDADCCYLGVNQHLANTYDLTPEAFVGQKINFLNSSPQFDAFVKKFFLSRAQKLTREIVSQVNGEMHTYLVAVQKYQDGNAAVSVGIDITTLKQTEEELRAASSRLSALIENLQAGVLVEDESGRILLINQVFCDIFQIPVIPATLIGADFAHFADEYQHNFAQPEQFVQRYREIVAARQVVTDEEILLADGRTFEQDYLPIFVAGDYCGHLWMYRDITERKRSEAELRQALAREKELGELKSRFVTNTSHEFRTPLTTILSSSELLEHYRHRWSEDKQLVHLHRIQKSVKHMTQLLNDILIIGKAEAGRLEFKPTWFDLELFCRELAEELQLSDKNQHMIALTLPTQGKQVWLDKKLLQHILTNLLANAMKYSASGSTINFAVTYAEHQVIFQIQDQGIGIPTEDQKHLFESFHRATNVGNIQGTGLGLSIVKKCVDVHGGKIEARSVVGEGTTFIVSLPLSKNH